MNSYPCDTFILKKTLYSNFSLKKGKEYKSERYEDVAWKVNF